VKSATAVWLLLGFLAMAACSSGVDSTPSSQGTVASTDSGVASTASVDSTPQVDSLPAGEQPRGFSTITAQIIKADGEICKVCLWLADSTEERGRGLMGVTDLGGPVGMAFVFEEAVNGTFYMFQTPTPLSIAWFAEDGSMVGVADMAPCLGTDSVDCPRYSPDAAYQLVIEVFEGGLPGLGLESGSSVQLLAGTESDTCLIPV
jgi:uncharacterized membrane protein (UPF0127 family)